MPTPLDLTTAKAHLRLSPTDTAEDALLAVYVAAVVGAFEVECKRRWPADNEPMATDATTTPPTVLAYYADPAVLADGNEQAIARQWLLLTLGHVYENRQSVITDARQVAVEVPLAAKYLMNLLRTPSL